MILHNLASNYFLISPTAAPPPSIWVTLAVEPHKTVYPTPNRLCSSQILYACSRSARSLKCPPPTASFPLMLYPPICHLSPLTGRPLAKNAGGTHPTHHLYCAPQTFPPSGGPCWFLPRLQEALQKPSENSEEQDLWLAGSGGNSECPRDT